MIKNVRFEGDKKIQGSCDEHIQQCIMPNSVKTCGPICSQRPGSLKMFSKRMHYFALMRRKMYTHCDKCLEDTDCIGFNRAKDKPETSTTTARCEFSTFRKMSSNLRENYTIWLHESKLKGTHIPGFKVHALRGSLLVFLVYGLTRGANSVVPELAQDQKHIESRIIAGEKDLVQVGNGRMFLTEVGQRHLTSATLSRGAKCA